MRSQSPERTETAFPQMTREAGWPRRTGPSSITSSCRSVAECVSSAATAYGTAAAHLAAAGAAGEERHHRTDALAARGDEVARRGTELLLRVVGRAGELLLERDEGLGERRDVGEGGLRALGANAALRARFELRQDGLLTRCQGEPSGRPDFNES